MDDHDLIGAASVEVDGGALRIDGAGGLLRAFYDPPDGSAPVELRVTRTETMLLMEFPSGKGFVVPISPSETDGSHEVSRA